MNSPLANGTKKTKVQSRKKAKIPPGSLVIFVQLRLIAEVMLFSDKSYISAFQNIAVHNVIIWIGYWWKWLGDVILKWGNDINKFGPDKL